jgi:hypothetical protein
MHYDAQDHVNGSPWVEAGPCKAVSLEVSRRRVPDAPLALCPRPAGWGHDLAAPMHRLSCGVHGSAAFRLALPLDAS